MTENCFEPFFLDTEAGRLFALFRAPVKAKHCVLLVPPFAEEMNKSRRQFTEVCIKLIDRGFATLLIDLFGTGDSDGEFSNASWRLWKQNVISSLVWAEDRGVPVDTLIATRLGCSLAAEALSDTERTVRSTVFWQPVVSGRQYMTQFLRLRVASSMMETDGNETVDGLRVRLKDGESLEVAGYDLSGRLWADVESSDLLRHLDKRLGDLMIFEIGRPRDGGLSPAGMKIISAAEQRDVTVDGLRVEGEPFWSTTEIVTNPLLSESTVQRIASGGQQ